MMADTGTAVVTSAELVRRFGRWQDRVASGPLFVTHHGRQRMVMLSLASYEALAGTGGAGAASNDAGLQLATVLDRMNQGFVAFGNDLAVIDANPAACAYLRRTRGELLGRPLSGEYPDLARSLVQTHLVRAIRCGETGAFDAPSFAWGAEWLHVQTFPYGAGAACLFRNITEEIAARREADGRTALVSAIDAHAAIGHARLSPRATFVEVDPALAAMCGFEGRSLLNARLTDILPLNRRVEAAAEVEAVLGSGGVRAFDTALLVNRGDELPVRIALAELRGDYSNEGAVVVVTPR